MTKRPTAAARDHWSHRPCLISSAVSLCAGKMLFAVDFQRVYATYDTLKHQVTINLQHNQQMMSHADFPFMCPPTFMMVSTESLE